jgi:hypothetical protein
VSDYVPDIVMSSLETCNVICVGPLGEEKGGGLGARGAQFITNQGRVWTSIRTTSFKGGDLLCEQEGGEKDVKRE